LYALNLLSRCLFATLRSIGAIPEGWVVFWSRDDAKHVDDESYSSDIITIYPNPTKGVFTVEAYSSIEKEIVLIDLLGNVILESTMQIQIFPLAIINKRPFAVIWPSIEKPEMQIPARLFLHYEKTFTLYTFLSCYFIGPE
jgi:hypothetical protein